MHCLSPWPSLSARPLRFLSCAVLSCAASIAPAQVVLDPMVVTVGRMEQRQSEVPVVTAVIEAAELEQTGVFAIDDALRSVAGFSLFRRAGSLTANPTTQGVSLRGLGASGTSRSLVLLDGVPFNDPFGGWVYWSKLPRESVDHVEIVRGGGSGVWGSGALSGIVSIHSEVPAGRSGSLALTAGEHQTAGVELAMAEPMGPGILQVDARWVESEGWHVIAPNQRGPVDQTADHRHVLAQLGWNQVTGGVRWSVRARHFEETRGNGTDYTGNRTEEDALSVKLEGGPGQAFSWSATGYAQTQEFSQTFARIVDDRSEEFPASQQYAVPSRAAGGALVGTWTHADASRTTVGGDVRWVTGETRELSSFGPDGFTRRRVAGGEQWASGVFARHERALTEDLRLTLSARADHAVQRDGHRRESEVQSGNLLRDDVFDGQENVEISPTLGLLWQPVESWRLRFAVYRAFRTPTLNELYRPFRVGNAITESNHDLQSETLDGVELGADWNRGPYDLSITAFANRLENAISNVTVARGPGTIPGFGFVPAGGVARRRSNLDEVRVHGIEWRAKIQLPAGFRVSVEYLLADNSVREARVNPELEGRSLAQVPRHSFIAEAGWSNGEGAGAHVRFRRLGGQFEDDENTLRLAPASVVDVHARWPLGNRWQAFASIENLLDEQVENGRSADGTISVAAPRFAHGGIRFVW